MTRVQVYIFWVKILAALLINVSYILFAGWTLYEDVVKETGDVSFYQAPEFYTHLVIFLLFVGSLVCGCLLYFKGEEGVARALLFPFYVFLRCIIPFASIREAGFVLLFFLLVLAYCFVRQLFF